MSRSKNFSLAVCFNASIEVSALVQPLLVDKNAEQRRKIASAYFRVQDKIYRYVGKSTESERIMETIQKLCDGECASFEDAYYGIIGKNIVF